MFTHVLPLRWLLVATLLLFTVTVQAQTGSLAVNTDGSQADGSALLDVKSTTQGVLVPRMTASQRTAISSPATGLLVYQTDATAGFYFYNGTAWTALNSGSPIGAAGGDLTGTYPNPTVANGAITGAKVANSTLPIGKLSTTGTAGTTTYLRGDGAWSSVPALPTGGTAGQVLTKVDGTDGNTQWLSPGAVGVGTLKDANNVTLGTVVSVGTTGAAIRTSAGYYVTVLWDGTFTGQQIYFSTTGCSTAGASMWLNSGAGTKRYQKFLVYEIQTGSFYSVANPDANGTATAVSFSYNSFYNISSCGNTSSTATGFLLTPISRATIGLPNTITPPLTVQ